MDPLGIIGIALGTVGIAVTVMIAYWQHKRAEKAEKNLQLVLQNLPSQLLNNVSRFLREGESEAHELYDLLASGKSFHSEYRDLNGDGRDELLIYYPYGAHGTALQVFSFQDWKFDLIAELEINTPAGFTFKDIDGDGRVEVVTHEVSDAADFPYVMGFRDEVWYHLEDDRFVEIKRTNLYDPEDLNKARDNPEEWFKEGQ
jgi:hypothetical protein